MLNKVDFKTIDHVPPCIKYRVTDNIRFIAAETNFGGLQLVPMTVNILDIDEVKSIPYTPHSHPFIERLIGTVRREFLDQTLFWNAYDLGRKLAEFRVYYNRHRTHNSLGGDIPAEVAGGTPKSPVALNNFGWQTH